MNEIKAPSKLLMLTEVRALLEIGAGVISIPFVKGLVPKGDGQPVLVLPGLAANDLSTKILRIFLKDLGYIPYGWELGINCGMQENTLERVVNRIRRINSLHNRKISLIGQSLGGLFARESAKIIPDMVRQVITLGSPFTGNIDATNAQWAYSLLSGQAVTQKERELYNSMKAKPNVPTTSIYSKLDGVVSWQCSIEENSHLAENIELIGSSHMGMASSPTALYVIAHRLAEREGYLQPFTPVAIMRPFYN